MLDSQGGWGPEGDSGPDFWMQIDLGAAMTVAGIVSQSRWDPMVAGNAGWQSTQQATLFTVQYSTDIDADGWTDVAGDFAANNEGDHTMKTESVFPEAVTARYVKIVVQEHTTGWIAMRAGVLIGRCSSMYYPAILPHRYIRSYTALGQVTVCNWIALTPPCPIRWTSRFGSRLDTLSPPPPRPSHVCMFAHSQCSPGVSFLTRTLALKGSLLLPSHSSSTANCEIFDLPASPPTARLFLCCRRRRSWAAVSAEGVRSYLGHAPAAARSPGPPHGGHRRC